MPPTLQNVVNSRIISAEEQNVAGDRVGPLVESSTENTGRSCVDCIMRTRSDWKVLSTEELALLSRGQAKAVASAMMVSQAQLLARGLNQTSVFLIDDVGAELDEGHNARFFQLLDDMDSQILATSTRLPRGGSCFAEERMTVFHVEHGRVQRSLND